MLLKLLILIERFEIIQMGNHCCSFKNFISSMIIQYMLISTLTASVHFHMCMYIYYVMKGDMSASFAFIYILRQKYL